MQVRSIKSRLRDCSSLACLPAIQLSSYPAIQLSSLPVDCRLPTLGLAAPDDSGGERGGPHNDATVRNELLDTAMAADAGVRRVGQ